MTGSDAPATSGAAAAAPADASGASKMTFRGAARLVLAARRFQAALNPTYTYGKRADSGGNAAPSAVSGWTRTDASSSSPSRTSSPVEIAAAKAAAGTGGSTPPLGTPPLGATPPKKVYDHHGHKGNLLLNPLPDIVLPAEKA